MQKAKIFPAGVATGAAFCNRERERGYLKQCLENNEHVVLVAPGRYGKTSLIAQLIQETRVTAVSIDLLLASLTADQRNVMLILAKSEVTEIHGAYMRQETGLQASSIAKAVDSLLKQDFLYQDDAGNYCVLDPAIHFFLLQKSVLE